MICMVLCDLPAYRDSELLLHDESTWSTEGEKQKLGRAWACSQSLGRWIRTFKTSEAKKRKFGEQQIGHNGEEVNFKDKDEVLGKMCYIILRSLKEIHKS